MSQDGKNPYAQDFETGARDRALRSQARQEQEAQRQKMAELQALQDRIRVLENAAQNPAQAQRRNHNGESVFAAGSTFKPNAFSGGYNPTFTEWIERFEEMAIAHKWEETDVLKFFLCFWKEEPDKPLESSHKPKKMTMPK